MTKYHYDSAISLTEKLPSFLNESFNSEHFSLLTIKFIKSLP